MFDRKLIKTNAKFVLKRSYWTGFAAILLSVIIISIVYMIAQSVIVAGVFGALSLQEDMNEDIAIWIAQPIMILLEIAALFFLISPAAIGLSRYFIATREQRNYVDFRYALYGFKQRYTAMSWAMTSTYLIIICWSLLSAIPTAAGIILEEITNEEAWLTLMLLSPFLMIPSVIYSYRYRMVPFILANNGMITGKRARELSAVMTDGNKWKLFVMDLSFLGWQLLGALLCGVGIYLVYPYMLGSYAEAYTCLKTEAIQDKKATDYEELPSMIGAKIDF